MRMLKKFTKPGKGSCACGWDLTKSDCACCKAGGKQCGYPMHKYCQSKKAKSPWLPLLLGPQQDGLCLVQEGVQPVWVKQELWPRLKVWKCLHKSQKYSNV